ncbi:hypothetical protein D3C76_1667000 [compost metagenome]
MDAADFLHSQRVVGRRYEFCLALRAAFYRRVWPWRGTAGRFHAGIRIGACPGTRESRRLVGKLLGRGLDRVRADLLFRHPGLWMANGFYHWRRTRVICVIFTQVDPGSRPV